MIAPDASVEAVTFGELLDRLHLECAIAEHPSALLRNVWVETKTHTYLIIRKVHTKKHSGMEYYEALIWNRPNVRREFSELAKRIMKFPLIKAKGTT